MHIACSCAMASNVPRSVETASEREETLRKRREHYRLRRERKPMKNGNLNAQSNLF